MIKAKKQISISEAKRIFFDKHRYNDYTIAGCFRLIQAINGKTNNIMDDGLSIANIERVLNGVDSEYRQIIIFRFWECYTLQEIADKYSVTRENIRQKQMCALQEVKRKLMSERFRFDEKTSNQKESGLNGLKPIEVLRLSGRTYNALRRAGINTVNRLITLSKKELLKIPNFGEWSLNEIQEKLNQYYPGIKLVSDKEFLKDKIEALEFPTYIENVLKRQGICKISDLIRLSDEQIRCLEGIGEKSVQIILIRKQNL